MTALRSSLMVDHGSDARTIVEIKMRGRTVPILRLHADKYVIVAVGHLDPDLCIRLDLFLPTTLTTSMKRSGMNPCCSVAPHK